MYTNLNCKPLRVCFAALLALFLIFISIPSVLAAPTDNPDTDPPGAGTFIEDPDGAYVELVVEVPEGFRGSVSAMLMNQETGKTYTITAFRVNFYSNSMQLPYGKYSVEQVYTSEDGMTYEAFIEEDEFDLNANYTLHAKVLHNEAGAAYVDGSSDIDKEPVTGSTTDTDVSSNPQNSGNTSSGTTTGTEQDPTPSDASASNKGEKADQQQNTPADDQPESSGSVVIYILKVIVGTAVFVGIIFGVVYLVRKNQGL